MASDDLTLLNDTLEGLIESLSPTARKNLTKDISRYLRSTQAKRIKLNRDPDGKKYEPRKRPKSRREIKFMYYGDERHLKSYRSGSRYIIGYDRFRGDIRTFRRDRIERYTKVDKGSATAAYGRNSQIRNRMFTNLIKTKWLKAKANPNEASVQFDSIADRVATVHQYGLRDRIGSGNQKVRYQERRLLGFTPEEQLAVEELIVEHLARHGL